MVTDLFLFVNFSMCYNLVLVCVVHIYIQGLDKIMETLQLLYTFHY
jgi:hypothetical protein